MTCLPCKAAQAAQTLKDGAKAMYQVATGDVLPVNDEIKRERLKHCSMCPDLRRYHDWLPMGADVNSLDRCGACGCFVMAKTAYDGFSCPNGIWHEINNKD